ncbi:transposase [Inhella sp.]|uniref:IS66-like element accessory protein TnpA n=1 Tax=Inhella sp. TaxID=1921806 RepID=UPI0035B2D390
MTSEKATTRRQYSAATKAQVMAQCDEPGASVAKVAMAHGINANVVHRWRQLAREGQAAAAKASEFIALPLATVPAAAPARLPADIRVELRRGPLTMSIAWPVSAVADFVAWSREWLR